MELAEQINSLVTKRGQCKAKLTRFTNFISKFDESKTIIELQARLDKMDPLWSEFEQIQSDIESLDISNAQDSERESFEDAYFNIVARARQIIVDKSDVPTTISSVRPTNGQNNSFKLPTISIPDFNGDYKEWYNFFDTFNALIESNNALTDIQRFYYLKTALKDEAKQLIESLEVSGSNYRVALSLLRERFENKKFIIRSHVEALFNMTSLTKESHKGVRNLLDELNKHLRALRNLGEQVESWDAMLIYLLTTKLDTITKRDWESLAAEFDSPTINDFKNFLTNKCKVLESLSSSNNNKYDNKFDNKPKNRVLAHVTTQGLECYFCKGTHYVYKCQDFLKLQVKARLNEIKRKKLCTNCLKPGHFSSECTSSACRKCNLKHNTLLHLEDVRPTSQNAQVQNKGAQDVQSLAVTDSSNKTEPDSLIVAHSSRKPVNNFTVLLSTAIIYVKDIKGNFIEGRALLDCGSQSNFISRTFFERLGYEGQKINVSVVGINKATTVISNSVRIPIKSLHNGFQTELTFLVIDKITSNIPAISFDSSNLNIPSNITLADPKFDTPGTVDVLLGVGIFYELLCVGQIKLGINKPILQKSKFGWLISGAIQNKNSQDETICNLSINQSIQGQLERFWAIEECSSELAKFTQEELECEKIFTETTFRNDTGRYVVTLPMRDSADKLGNSLSGALQRFLSLEKRLSTNANLKQQYSDFMQEYEVLGHMTKVDNNLDVNKDLANYLPHHGVIKNSSITTKLRVVYDASAKTTTNLSLNDILMTGPNIQDSLFSILLRFRKHNYVITADVEKMYRQVDIIERQRDLQRIIWRNNPNETLNHFRLNTITYGTAPASFLAVRVLHELAAENSEAFPAASRAILKDFYVDDLITGSDTINNTIQLKQDISSIFNSAGMTLRKWKSNDSYILNDLNNKIDKSQYYIIDDVCVKTLGVLWNAKLDTFQFTTNTDQNSTVTKRSILSSIARMFDPLGIIGPVIIKIKMILQALWQLNIEWDESLPTSLYTEWIRIRDKINLLSNLDVPRHVMLLEPTEIELHGFCDASENAYGCCVYIRSIDSHGACKVRLLCAKSRVAPLKKLTLPRLELCGAVLLAHLVKEITKTIDINFHKQVYWCDSTITIYWIRTSPNKLKTFIANRVADIQSITNVDDWRHIKSADNPADLISRGLFPEDFLRAKMWFNGPEWLHEQPADWPLNIIEIVQESDLPEIRNTQVSLYNQVIDFDLFERFSSLHKLQRVVALCFRFYYNLGVEMSSRKQGPITLDELQNALKRLIKVAQQQIFYREISCLTNKNLISTKSPLLALNPFLDNDNIIRVGGRLENSYLSYDAKHPIIMPNNHPLTKLIIDFEHRRNLHAGTQATLAAVRQKYWPLKGKSVVKGILRKCMTCFKARPTTVDRLMGNLPKERVQYARAFLNCGLDYAGPFYIKDGKYRNRKIVKSYLCMFVCMATKAVHLELVGDLTSESFINAFKRFTSRRGLCKAIFSDNGSNFVGANNMLTEISTLVTDIYKDKNFKEYIDKNSISWHFIPAKSPHFGGLWEAAIKSAKFHIKRVIGNAHLTFEELSTIFAQVEAVLNSRPLTPISSDPNDFLAITPGHFLIGDSLMAVPQENVKDVPSHRLSRFRYLQQVLQHFWSIWSREYLTQCQQRNKWKRDGHLDLRPGAMVLLRDENSPPLKWPLGRITDLHPGCDGVVRVVTVRTTNGQVKRAVNKICLLPIDTDIQRT